MKKFKHIIFDLDGTIYDTDKSVFKIWEFLLNREFPQFDTSKVDFTITLGVSTKLAMEKMGLPYTDEFDHMFTKEYHRFAHLISIYNGMEDTIKALKDQGYVLGIVSSRPYREYDAYLKPFGLDIYFDSKVLKDDTNLHKPNAEPLLKYIERNNLNKEDCIYIGDMDTDILCAKNAGIKSGLMVWDKTKTFNEKADIVFNNAEELKTYFMF